MPRSHLRPSRPQEKRLGAMLSPIEGLARRMVAEAMEPNLLLAPRSRAMMPIGPALASYSAAVAHVSSINAISHRRHRLFPRAIRGMLWRVWSVGRHRSDGDCILLAIFRATSPHIPRCAGNHFVRDGGPAGFGNAVATSFNSTFGTQYDLHGPSSRDRQSSDDDR